MISISRTSKFVDRFLDKKADISKLSKKSIKDLDATDWQLYKEERGAEAVAKKISQKLAEAVEVAKQAIKAGAPKQKIAIALQKEFQKFMKRYDYLGATDTEPESILNAIINQQLGTNISRWGD
jgi:hypothetical protein